MIKADVQLSIERIPIGCILVTEARPRYAATVQMYVRYLQENPHHDPGLLEVVPSRGYPGLYELKDGHHRFVASIIAGRSDVLSVVIDEKTHE